ncbi:hypothetical protein [Streptomyces boninensis]|uniref:hypothetical protein n=1 Tax=Streptomyces boninensis TaxID=2039455 RepID=UPI003B20FD0A
MPDPESVLAMTAATTIVAAMATNAWETTRAGVARIFRRAAEEGPETPSGAVIEVRLDRSAAQIGRADEPDRAREAQAGRWRVYLEDLLQDHPEAAAELTDLVADVQRQLPPVHQQWIMHVVARDGGSAYGAQGPGSRVIVHPHPEPPEARR